MSTWSFTVKDRRNKFKNVLIHLLRSVLLPGSTTKCFQSRVSGQPSEWYEKVCKSHWSVIAGAPQFRHEDDDPSMKKAATMT
ncbi:unnamed protein product [Peronospora effusa]|nr:unnamed protein product [Peronospora effusa]